MKQMPDPAKLRDSTQIVVPCSSISEIREDLEQQFAVTVFNQDTLCRIIGSPVEIKAASKFLSRHGISIP